MESTFHCMLLIVIYDKLCEMWYIINFESTITVKGVFFIQIPLKYFHPLSTYYYHNYK